VTKNLPSGNVFQNITVKMGKFKEKGKKCFSTNSATMFHICSFLRQEKKEKVVVIRATKITVKNGDKAGMDICTRLHKIALALNIQIYSIRKWCKLAYFCFENTCIIMLRNKINLQFQACSCFSH
jgi:hypothetical protein